MAPDRSIRVVVDGADLDDPIAELTLPALMIRSADVPFAELVHIYTPRQPTVAFSARDARSPTFGDAVRVAREHGFAPVIRSPGGRMVAYGEGAVVIDHVDLGADRRTARSSIFATNALAHADVLTRSGAADVRVGEVADEYCPGEFSLNVGGTVKVAGSAQRIAGRGALFSTIVQVDMSEAVRHVLAQVSTALGYRLAQGTVGGLRDFVPGLTARNVADAFADDYRTRLQSHPGGLPGSLVAQARLAAGGARGDAAFSVDDWARAQ